MSAIASYESRPLPFHRVLALSRLADVCRSGRGRMERDGGGLLRTR